jgi:hypothetical protein
LYRRKRIAKFLCVEVVKTVLDSGGLEKTGLTLLILDKKE